MILLYPGTTLYEERKMPPLIAQAPMAITHFGSAIWLYIRFTVGAIFQVRVPAVIIRSAWRGEARRISIPKRDISKRGPLAAMNSKAQQAGKQMAVQSEERCPQLMTASTVVSRMFSLSSFSSSHWSGSVIIPWLSDLSWLYSCPSLLSSWVSE